MKASKILKIRVFLRSIYTNGKPGGKEGEISLLKTEFATLRIVLFILLQSIKMSY